MLDEAEQIVRGTDAAVHVANLREVANQLVTVGLGPRLGVDLGEIRGAAYYTGVSFALLAQGPGEAIASGGRYDQLLAQYGAPQPATGAAIDVENLLAALDHAGLPWRERDRARFAVAGTPRERVDAVARKVRELGSAAAALPDLGSDGASAYARAWSYHAVLLVSDRTLVALRADGAMQELGSELSHSDLDALASWARSPSANDVEARANAREQNDKE